MTYNGGRRDSSTLPPFSNRTLHHPSFLPLYMAAAFPHHLAGCDDQTVLPIIPAEFFYTDPSMSCGRRVPNIVSELRVFDCFQLNTPPPLMSTCPAPPTRPDPFRSGPLPARDLGSLALKAPRLAVLPNRVVLQLTQEEDQAITNLLKLHHQEPAQRDETQIPGFLHPQLLDSAEGEHKRLRGDARHPREAGSQRQPQEGRRWSDAELEAANALLSCFGLMEGGKIWSQNHNKPAGTLPDPLPHHNDEDSRGNTEPQRGSEAFFTQNAVGYVSFSPAREYDFGFTEGRDVHPHDRESSPSFGGKEQTLSDSEGDAVHVLLSLGDTAALDMAQCSSQT